MKTWIVKSAGGPEQMVLVDQPMPEPGPGQVLVAVAAAGVGYADVLLRRGAYPGVDVAGRRLGEEIAGTVQAVGQGVSAALVGRRVYAHLSEGGYAEAACFDADLSIELPDEISFEAAVAAGENALVAELALSRAQIAPGDSVLVRGASGAMASTIVQFVVDAGGICTAATSKPDAIASLGAHHVVDRSGGDGPFDVVIDTVAGEATGSFIGKLKPNGRLLLCGAAGGFPPPDFAVGVLINFLRSPTVSVLSLNSISSTDMKAAARHVFAKIQAGRIAPLIAKTIALGDIPDAHRAMEENEVTGKIVMKV